MGITELSPDEGNGGEENSDGPSVSYIYIYEEGRDELENWTDQQVERMAEAYAQSSGGGTVRNQFKSSGKFQNIHDAVGQYLASLGTAFEHPGYIPPVHQALVEDVLPALHESLDEGNVQPLLEFVEPDADDLREFIENSDEVGLEEVQPEAAD